MRAALDNAARFVEHHRSSADGRPAMTRSELCARDAAATSLSNADIAASRTPSFKAGKTLRDAVNA